MILRRPASPRPARERLSRDTHDVSFGIKELNLLAERTGVTRAGSADQGLARVAGLDGGGGPVSYLQFHQDRRDVVASGLVGHAELPGDLGVAGAAGQQAE